MKKIIIENTKSIKRLDFIIPEKNNVYLLVGANGSGKSTLLVCLERICNSYAFARGFFTPATAEDIDQYENAAITYCIDTENITFRKANTRWTSARKPNSTEFLKRFGFAESFFIKADSKRFDIKQDEIKRGKYILADEAIINTLNDIFETRKFINLKLLKISRGKGRGAIYFYAIRNGKNDNYSEKRFSSGELATLRLVESIQRLPDKSLVLLDEAEMALHPRIQKNLLDYIQLKANEKDLMVFVSTHSSTLINSTPKDRLILLEHDEEKTHTIFPCYSAQAIGSIDYLENSHFDHIFFVEDDMAKTLLDKMIKRYRALEPNYSGIYIVEPIGTYYATALFATTNRFFNYSRVFAVLDEDAFHSDNPKFKQLCEDHPKTVRSLGFTPELWMIEQLEGNDDKLRKLVKEQFHCDISCIIKNEKYLSCRDSNERTLAKKKFHESVKILIRSSGKHEQIVIDSLAELLINKRTDGEIKKAIAPMVST